MIRPLFRTDFFIFIGGDEIEICSILYLLNDYYGIDIFDPFDFVIIIGIVYGRSSHNKYHNSNRISVRIIDMVYRLEYEKIMLGERK